MVVNAGVESPAIIEPHVETQRSVQLVEALKGSAPYPFCFHGVEEGFHMGIVLAVVGSVHADQKAMSLKSVHIGSAAVFHAPVGVEDAARGRSSTLEGMHEGSGREPHSPIFPQGPAEYLP